jgi:hypothetical protein
MCVCWGSQELQQGQWLGRVQGREMVGLHGVLRCSRLAINGPEQQAAAGDTEQQLLLQGQGPSSMARASVAAATLGGAGL